MWAHRALLYAIAPLSHIDASKVSKGVVEEGLMDNSVSWFTLHTQVCQTSWLALSRVTVQNTFSQLSFVLVTMPLGWIGLLQIEIAPETLQ